MWKNVWVSWINNRSYSVVLFQTEESDKGEHKYEGNNAELVKVMI
jgi:hypothetical protein